MTSATLAPSSAAQLPRSTPEAQGVSSQAILDFVTAADAQVTHMHSFMLLRHGQVIAEAWWKPYVAQEPHMLFSLTKSFASTAIGMAVGEGKLSLDDQVIRFFPEDVPANPDQNLRDMKLRHLLMMGTGHSKDPTGITRQAPDGNWTRAFLHNGPDLAPGSKFVYNSAASYMLGAILHKVTGQTLKEYLTPRLFEPLGIALPEWEVCPRGLSTGGWGLFLKTEDIAKFGQMLLNKGEWNGRQVLSPEWIREASGRQIDNGPGESDWNQGYGYQFWRCRHNLYRGDGAFGQFCIVMPEQDVVLAITSGSNDMGLQMNLAWEHLLPALSGSNALPADATTLSQLRQRLGTLTLPVVKGEPTSPQQQLVGGRKYVFSENPIGLEWLRINLNGANPAIEIKRKQVMIEFTSSHGEWLDQNTPEGPGSSSCAWTSPDTFTTLTWMTRTTFAHSLQCTFKGDDVAVELGQNVAFGEKHWGPFTARAVSR